MFLIVGLGNPGPKYAQNRHNIGFVVADAIADQWKFGPEKQRFQGLTREGEIASGPQSIRAVILRPQTFMNESGRSVGEAARYLKIEPRNIIVFYDELDLAPGRVRVKLGGGAAGHNGVRSLVAHIGENFRRVRLGIGHPGMREAVHGHVLSDFSKSEREWVSELSSAIAQNLPSLLHGEDDRFQSQLMQQIPAPKFNPRQAAHGDAPIKPPKSND